MLVINLIRFVWTALRIKNDEQELSWITVPHGCGLSQFQNCCNFSISFSFSCDPWGQIHHDFGLDVCCLSKIPKLFYGASSIFFFYSKYRRIFQHQVYIPAPRFQTQYILMLLPDSHCNRQQNNVVVSGCDCSGMEINEWWWEAHT